MAGNRLDTLRVHRVEVVDLDGSVRATLGPFDADDPARSPTGLALYDPAGRRRAALGLGAGAAWLTLELDGNGLVEIGVYDRDSDAAGTRVYVVVATPDGRPVAGWQADDDGVVRVLATQRPPGVATDGV
jgi:hypothetical protein